MWNVIAKVGNKTKAIEGGANGIEKEQEKLGEI